MYSTRENSIVLVKRAGKNICKLIEYHYKGIFKLLCLTYVEVGDVLPIQGLVDRQFSRDRVNDEDPSGGLVSTWSCDAVSERPVFVMVRPDLWVLRLIC